jgi:selenocysteine lyase/cysteine desulfurase
VPHAFPDPEPLPEAGDPSAETVNEPSAAPTSAFEAGAVPPLIDIDRVRAETPAVARIIHFNNAGAGLMPEPVLDAVVGHLRIEAEIGGYEAAGRAEPTLEHTYTALAALLNAGRDEIALIENATRAWDMAFYGLGLGPGDRILTGANEYASNVLAFLHVGAEVVVVPDDETGQLDVGALERLIDDRVKLIAVTHVPTNGGLVNPAEEIGRVAHSAGIPYLLDACQSVGQIPLDVEKLHCDMLSGTGRKYLRGPRGTGFLYVRRAMQDRLRPPMIDLHAATWTAPDRYELRPDARRFENWESYVAGRIGLGVAADYALALGIEPIAQRVSALAETLRACLRQIPGVAVHDLGSTRCGIVSFTAGENPDGLRRALRARGANTSVSGRASTRFDMERRGLDRVVRASVHYYNTEDEIERFCAILRGLI